MSVTEIEQNPQTKTVQVSVRIFYDDFEKALTKQYKSQVNILKPVDRKKLDLLIADYIANHLKIKANAKTLSLKYLGYEIEEEAAWCYFETEKQAEVQSITVMNNILFEQHTTQINMIHVIVSGKRKSSKLNNPANSVSFQF